MDTQQLLDALTDHISLYHRHKENCDSRRNIEAEKIKLWMEGLNVKQRQAALTVVDSSWVAIVLKMQERLEKDGPGFFFLLPDLPVPADNGGQNVGQCLNEKRKLKQKIGRKRRSKVVENASQHAKHSDEKWDEKMYMNMKGSNDKESGLHFGLSLPSLCFRKAQGLLRRLTGTQMAEDLLLDNIQLFSSQDGDKGICPILDTLILNEKLLENLNEFCSTMDIITSNAFLKEQAPSSFSSWEETSWLKDRGYYSLAAFVANKLEFTIWSAWIHFIGAKRPPKTISKLCFQIASEKASTALRICNHRQELREKWGKLDLRTKQKVLQYAVSKVAKSEALKVIQETKSSLNSVSTLNGKLQASPAAPYIRATELILESVEMTPMLFSLQMDYLFCSPLQLIFASASVVLLLERIRSGIIAAINGSAEADLLTSDSIRNEMTGQTVRGKTRRRKCKKQSGNIDMKNAVPSYPPEDRPLTKACKRQDGNGSLKPNKDMGRQAKNNQSIKRNGATDKSQMINPESVMKLNGHDGYDAETGVEDKNNELVGKIVTQSDLIAEAIKRESIGVSETTDVSTQELYTGINTHDDTSSPLPTCSVGYIIVHDDVKNQSEFGESGICPSIENNQNGFDGKTKARTTKLSNTHVTSSKKDILPHCSSRSVDLGPNFSHISSIERSSNTSLASSLSMNLNPSSNPVRSQTASVNCDAYANHKNGMDKLSTDGSMPPPASIINLGPTLLPSLKNRGVGTCRTSAVPLCISHEWPRPPQTRFCGSSDHMQPATADRLHLDVSKTWAKHQKASWISRSNSVAVRRQTTHGETIPQRNTINTTLRSWDWPPLFRPSVTTHFSLPSINHTPLQSTFPGYSLEASSKAFDELDGFDRTMDDSEFDNSSCMLDEMDDAEGFFISEEVESSVDDTEILYNTDYNQIFGGGVMYWTSADYTGMGYSRPGSLSSEDSAWARHEADLSTVLDDIVGISAFNSAASSLGSSSSSPSVSHQWRSLQQVGSEYGPKFAFSAANHMEELDIGRPTVSSVRGAHGEIPSLDSSNQVLPPIIVTRASKAELNKLHEARSPHMPRGRRDMFKWKRSPSPVLRCVPPAPPPPPPSPIAGIRKCRGLSIARSGSSSPRHWGLCCRTNSEEKQMQEDYLKSGTDAILKNGWRSCITSTPPMYPLSGALLCERLIAIPPLALEQDHPDAAFPMQTTTLLQNNPAMHQAINVLHATLHKEIEAFCFQVARENLARKSYIDSAVRKVTHALQVLWPRSRTNVFGSNATGLALPNSDVDLVVCLPPVRNLEPIKEAGILEGRNGIKETCLQHAARYLADQDWVKSDSLKTIENTAIPIIMLVAEVVPSHDDGNIMLQASREETHALNSIQQEHCDKKLNPWGCEDRKFVRLDISFEAPSHTGLHTAELVRKLLAQFPAITPLALVLKQFLMDRSLDQPYTGGLSSYCLVLLITRFLQHQNHIGLSSQHQNLGNLLMDFLHFFGCVFDTRRMCVCIRGDGLYVNRARTHSIDPLHIEDPLHPVNNVGRNCFRILQCTKAFADAYATLERVLHSMSSTPLDKTGDWKLLQKILPSISGLD